MNDYILLSYSFDVKPHSSWVWNDFDTILAYDTKKMVRVRDYKLGLVYYGMCTGIVVYVFVWEILMSKNYMLSEQPRLHTTYHTHDTHPPHTATLTTHHRRHDTHHTRHDTHHI